jgi:hypothetical protein
MAKQPQRKPDDDDETETDDFTEAQLNKLGGLVNAAVSKQLGRQLDKAVGTALAPQLAELKELIQGKAKAVPAGEETEDEDTEEPPAKPAKGKAGKPAARPTGPDPAVAAMQRELAQIKEERAKERTQAAAAQRDGALRDHLGKLGVKPELMRGAVAILRESTRQDDKTGEWSYVAQRDGYTEELDLGAGAKDWIGTDEGKAHVAAPEKPRPGGVGMPRVIGGNGGARPAASGDVKTAKAQKVAGAYEQLAQAAGALVAGGDLPSS